MDKRSRRRRRHIARHARSRRSRPTALGAAAGREPHPRHDRGAPRLGDLAPARLGRADRGVRARKSRDGSARSCKMPRSTRASSRRSRAKARTPGMGGRARALPRQLDQRQRLRRRSTTSSTSGSTPAPRTPSCWRIRSIPGSPASAYRLGGRHRDVSRRLRPASRLVPFLAAGEPAARAGARRTTWSLTHGFTLDEHGRKMSKSLGNIVAPQDVIKQSGADILRMWVCAVGLCRRPAHRAGNPRKPRSRPIASCATPSATCSAGSRSFTRGRARQPREMPELER